MLKKTILTFDGSVDIKSISRNITSISVNPLKNRYCKFRYYQTKYPLELIEKIIFLKGSCWCIDEIKREESPDYVKRALEYGLFSFINKEEFTNKTLLDFGCGSGASCCLISKMLPNTKIVGIDLSSKLLEIAKMRINHYGLEKKIELIHSQNSQRIPYKEKVDYIVLSAVYEHLLPEERKNILAICFSILRRGGVLFINQTPNRWAIYENHTTGLIFINYLNDKLTYWYAKRLSNRKLHRHSWEKLLRMGIRGSSKNEIKQIIKTIIKKSTIEQLRPKYLGVKNDIDLWYRSTSRLKGHSKLIKKLIRFILNLLPFLSPFILPGLIIALRKK